MCAACNTTIALPALLPTERQPAAASQHCGLDSHQRAHWADVYSRLVAAGLLHYDEVTSTNFTFLLCGIGTIYLPATVLFSVGNVPFSANILALMGISLFMAILFPTIYGIALGGLNPKCFKLGGPGMIMAILGGAVITPWMASVISAHDSIFFRLLPMMDFTWDANLRTSSGALRASFFIPAICFVVMFVYAVAFRKPPRGWNAPSTP